MMLKVSTKQCLNGVHTSSSECPINCRYLRLEV